MKLFFLNREMRLCSSVSNLTLSGLNAGVEHASSLSARNARPTLAKLISLSMLHSVQLLRVTTEQIAKIGLILFFLAVLLH